MGNRLNIGNLIEETLCEIKSRLDLKKAKKSFHVPIQNRAQTRDILSISPSELALMIDHTLLKADASTDDLSRICKEAREYNFKTVCVNSANIPYVRENLMGSLVLPITVVGFPLGAMLTKAKVFETEEAIRSGAGEIDMVINIGKLKSGDLDFVYNDIRSIIEASGDIPVKVIIETALLSDKEKIAASHISKEAGAAFVKTSTGFASGGANEDDLKLIRRVVGNDCLIKASGGIKTYDDAIKMIRAGADRIGSSASVSIINELKKRNG